MCAAVNDAVSGGVCGNDCDAVYSAVCGAVLVLGAVLILMI